MSTERGGEELAQVVRPRISLAVDATLPSGALQKFQRVLTAGGGIVDVTVVEGPPLPLLVRAALADRSRDHAASDTATSNAPASSAHDVSIDLSSRPTSTLAKAGADLRVTYDGGSGDAALYAALLAGRAPVVEVLDTRTGKVLASGKPCINDAINPAQAVEFVLVRTAMLIRKALDTPETRDPLPAAEPGTATNAMALKWFGRRLSRGVLRAAFRSLFHTPQWCVGYRLVKDDGVLERASLAGEPWRVLPEVDGHFYADPFPIIVDGVRYIFFEDLDHKTNKGTVSYVRLDEMGHPGPVLPALEEQGHLSYPFLFEEDGEIYMVPEQSSARAVVLYRAAPFPDTWVKDTVLLSDVDIGDATITKIDGRYWMFATSQEGASPSDMMAVYYADALRGPWIAHPQNPILIDKTSARPAGSMVMRDGNLWRPTQDCSYGYGSGLSLVEITHLTPDRVEQHVRHKIWPGSDGWLGHRLHTLSRYGDVECIDGAGVAGRNWLTRKLAAMPAVRRLLLK